MNSVIKIILNFIILRYVRFGTYFFPIFCKIFMKLVQFNCGSKARIICDILAITPV